MKISTEIASMSHLVGEEKAVELLAKAGFDAWDFSMFAMVRYDWTNRCLLPNDHPLCRPDYLKFARGLRNIGLDNGITTLTGVIHRIALGHYNTLERCATIKSISFNLGYLCVKSNIAERGTIFESIATDLGY